MLFTGKDRFAIAEVSFETDDAYPANTRVVLTGNITNRGHQELTVADDTEVGVGTLVRRTVQDDMDGALYTRNASGPIPYIADAVMPANTPVFAAAAGRVSAAGSVPMGTTITASEGVGDNVLVIPPAT